MIQQRNMQFKGIIIECQERIRYNSIYNMLSEQRETEAISYFEDS